MSQRGQAMTEFLIVASFVLVPLFLGVPMLAKYIDIKHATIQAARYQAWEYIAWYNPGDDNDILDNFEAYTTDNKKVPVTLPMKTTAATRSEARRRLFSTFGEADTLPITASDAGAGWTPAVRNPLWTDYRRQLLYDGAAGTESLDSDEATPALPVVGTVLNTMTSLVGTIFKGMGAILGLGKSNAGFTAINNNGYARSQVATVVNTQRGFVDTATLYGAPDNILPANLELSARAGVITDGWNSGGLRHTYNQAQGAVPSVLLKTLLNLPVMNVIWNVVSLLAPELSSCHSWAANLLNYNDGKGSLWFGHIDIDAVPPDRLVNGGGPGSGIACDDAGRCNFTYAIPRPEPDCVP